MLNRAFLLLALLAPLHLFSQEIEVSPYLVRQYLDRMPEGLWFPNEVLDAYHHSGYRVIWTSTQAISELKNAVAVCADDGLQPADYHPAAFEAVTTLPIHPQDIVAKDVYMTDAYLALAHHLKRGRLQGSQLFPADWDPNFYEDDFVVELMQAVHDHNVARFIESLPPRHPLYHQLKTELLHLNSTRDTTAYDSIEQMRTMVRLNMEKARWLADMNTTNVIWINIPSFQLMWYSHDSLIMNMRAVVGRPERKTPIINSQIRSVVINPEWVVPPTILKEDVLPAVQSDRGYLKKNRLRLIDHDGLEISPDSISWTSLSSENFPYAIKQDAGARSALGLLKFQFANRHGVYIHDTNMHALFSQPNRALSSGCIRIEKPFSVAVKLLSHWTEQTLRDSVETGRTVVLTITKPVPVHTTYFTLTRSDDGWQVWPDVYGWDRAIAEALNNLDQKRTDTERRGSR